jgi:hypothetical protein
MNSAIKQFLLKLYFILLFTALGLQSNAQSDYRSAYIVTNANDTIFGLIDYKNDKANSRICYFKKETGSQIVEYSPGQIQGYRFIDNKYYVSRFVNTGVKEELIFLEYLLNGIVDIFYYRDGPDSHYFIDKGDNRLLALTNTEKKLVVNNNPYDGTYITYSKEYQNQLKYIFSASPSTYKKTSTVSLNHKSLIRISSDYHKEMCPNEECIVYEKKLPKVSRIFGPLIGFNLISAGTNNNFTDNFFYLRNSDFDVKMYPSIGFFYKVNMPYVNERLHLKYEAKYGKWSLNTSTSAEFTSFGEISYYDIKYVQNTFNNTLLLGYEFPKQRRVKPNLQAGVFAEYFFKTNYSCKIEDRWILSGSLISKSDLKENPFIEFDFGLTFGTGFTTKTANNRELFLDLKYQRGVGMSVMKTPGYFQNPGSNIFSVNFGIQLWK